MTNNIPAMSDLAIAGAAAEGNGAITGWNGSGPLTRSQILEILENAGLPANWAPRGKSAVAHLGTAINTMKSRGLLARKAPIAKWNVTDQGKSRAYCARWIVAEINSAFAEVGENAGEVVATATLRDSSDDLELQGNSVLCAALDQEYTKLRENEVYTASDVTRWIRDILTYDCKSARFGIGYYIPVNSRDLASRFVSAIAEVWGYGWISPLLPVATSEELRLGLAKGFVEELQQLEDKLAEATEKAVKKGKDQVSPTIAANMLKDLADLDKRAEAYKNLLGDAMSEPIEKIRNIHDTLAPIADDVSLRFAMLDLDGGPTNATIVQKSTPVAPAVKAAERAYEEKIQGKQEVKEETPVNTPDPSDFDDSAERFGLLELD